MNAAAHAPVTGAPASIHVYHGGDSRAIEDAIRTLAASLRDSAGLPIRFDTDADPGAVYQELYTPILLGGGRKLIVLLDFPRRGERDGAKSGGENEAKDEADESSEGAGSSWAVRHKKLLQEVFDAPPADVVFVLATPRWPLAGLKAPAGRTIEKAFKARKDYEKDQQAPGLAAALFAERRKRIAPDALRVLLDRVAPERGLLSEAAEVLCLHAGPREEVTRADVEALIQATRPGNTFAMTRAIVFGETARALDQLHRLRAHAKSPEGFGPLTVGAIAWQFRVVARSLEALADGDRGAALKPWYGVRPDDAPRLIRRLEALRGAPLARAREWILETDLAIKTGRGPIRLALETLVVRLAALGGARR